MEYTFVKDYKEDEILRKSFAGLAKKTFGIDFEKWYVAGGWNENYIPYSYRYGNEIAANVSVNTMNLVINGEVKKAIQIGTVMTDPQHRRKGLASGLMKAVLEDYDEEYDLYFLAADEDAVSLYKKHGFEDISAKEFMIDAEKYRRIENPLQSRRVSVAELMKHKERSIPLSDTLSAVNDKHILAFYYTHGFSECIYEIYGDTLAIFKIRGSVLHLYDILSPHKFSLEKIIETITPKSVDTIRCHFTPDRETKGLSIRDDHDGGWMIRCKGRITFPDDSVYPEISKA